MREIKFRAWNKKMNRMYNMSELDFDLYPFLNGERENWIPLQYTGLKDKNGKEIYEGDILKVFSSEIYCEVIFVSPSFCRKWHHKKFIELKGEVEPMAWNTPLVYEVVGNIYETSELLEGVS